MKLDIYSLAFKKYAITPKKEILRNLKLRVMISVKQICGIQLNTWYYFNFLSDFNQVKRDTNLDKKIHTVVQNLASLTWK